MRNQSLGFNIDQRLVSRPMVGIDLNFFAQDHCFQELQQQSSVKSITVSSSIPGENGWNAGGIGLVGEDGYRSKKIRVIGVDYDYIKTFEIKLIAGRAFSKDLVKITILLDFQSKRN